MILPKKVLFLLIIILLFLSFSYGFISHRQKLPPYGLIKNIFAIFLGKQQNIKGDNNIRKKHSSWNKLNKNFKPIKEVFLKDFIPGINIFSDRNYFNHKNDKDLEGLKIVQLPKHYPINVNILSSEPITVYRPVCKNNNNETYNSWDKTDIEILIISHSCIHTKVFKKEFKSGEISLKPGGPKSADPIFLLFKKKNTDLLIKTVPPENYLVPEYKLK